MIWGIIIVALAVVVMNTWVTKCQALRLKPTIMTNLLGHGWKVTADSNNGYPPVMLAAATMPAAAQSISPPRADRRDTLHNGAISDLAVDSVIFTPLSQGRLASIMMPIPAPK